jgi:hypothetical protein
MSRVSRNFIVCFQRLNIALGGSTQHSRDMAGAKKLEHMRRNFDVDPGRADPEAKHRRTRKEARHALIRETIGAYMSTAPVSERTMKQAVSWAKEGFEQHFGVKLHERTFYEALSPSRRRR